MIHLHCQSCFGYVKYGGQMDHSCAFLWVRNFVFLLYWVQVSVGVLAVWWNLYIFLIFGST